MTTPKKLIFLAAYLVFFAAVVEGSAQLAFVIPRIYWKLFADDNYSWQRIWAGQRRLRASELDKQDVYDSTKGWRPKPNLRNVAAYDHKIVNTNSRGLRGVREFAYEKTPGQLRIVVLGDSFTFGEEVSDDETYTHFLQQLMPEAEVINLGVHGYGHDQMLILLEEEGLKYRPDIVLLGFLPMDMARNVLSFRDFAKPRFVVRDGGLELTGVPVPTPDRMLWWDRVRPRTLDILSVLSLRIRDRFGWHQREIEVTTAAILARMIDVVRRANATPVLAYLPFGADLSGGADPLPGEMFMHTLCRSDNGARCFSTRPVFRARVAAGQSFKMTGHWDVEGHRAAAEAIHGFLVREGVAAAREGSSVRALGPRFAGLPGNDDVGRTIGRDPGPR